MLSFISKSVVVLLLFFSALPAASQPFAGFELAIGQSLTNVNPFPFGDETASCVGENVIEKIGRKRLRSLGIRKDNVKSILGRPPFTSIRFTDQEIEHLLDSVDECKPFIEIWDYVVKHSKNAGDWLDTEEINDALTHCITTVFSNDLPRALWHALYTKPNAVFQEKFKELSDPTTGCFEAIFCGKATILGSYGMPATVLPGGGSVLFDYGGGTGGLTFNYVLPVIGMNVCPFTAPGVKGDN